MKYQPQFPQRFGCIQDAKAFCRSFFDWYNQDHHHAGIGLMTPDQVHYGQADAIHAARQNTLDGAFSRNPERFVRKEPQPPAKPIATWINPPCGSLSRPAQNKTMAGAFASASAIPHRRTLGGKRRPDGMSCQGRQPPKVGAEGQP